MTTKLLILGAARSGSSFLKEVIDSHPDVLMHGEPFQTANIEWHIHPLALPEVDLSRRSTDPVGFIDDLFARDHGHTVVGMKILFGQNDGAMRVFADRRDVKKIFLRRANLLAQFSSFALATRTNVWNARHGAAVADRRIPFDGGWFRKFLAWERERSLALEASAQADPGNWTTIWYDAANPMTMAAAAARFLGFDDGAFAPSTFKRLHPGAILNRFEKPAEVEAALDEIGRPEWRTE